MKTNQKGRSMVEMLGVLAIIGVLSVGAIAGYSKAMFKYKMNKTMDIISHTITRLAELDTMRLNADVEYDTSLLVKYGLMPDCNLDYINKNGDAGRSCPLPLGEVTINFSQSENYPMYANLNFDFLQEPFDSCVAFLSSGIYNNTPDDWWTPLCDDCYGGFINISSEDKAKYALKGTKARLTNLEILEACESCKDAESCSIYWVIRNDF